MSRLLSVLLDLVKQLQTTQRERDPIAGRTTKKTAPPTRRVEHGVRVEYSPELDGDADPGEVVWAWVPFEDDPSRGKDRPVVVVGRVGGHDLAAVPLTSKNKGRADHVAVGTGGWDPQRRDSWAKVDRLLTIDEDDVRREGSALSKDRFDDVIAQLSRYHEIVRA